jgi:hypothetical protein
MGFSEIIASTGRDIQHNEKLTEDNAYLHQEISVHVITVDSYGREERSLCIVSKSKRQLVIMAQSPHAI